MFWNRKPQPQVVAVIDNRKDDKILAAALTGLLAGDATMRQDPDKVAARAVAIAKAVEELVGK